jgi:hypothetical protein
MKNNKLPSEHENPNGLHNRYYVSKVSGEPIDEFAEYFILRLDGGGDDINHINACRKAIVTYAENIEPHLPQLAKDLIERYGDTIK